MSILIPPWPAPAQAVLRALGAPDDTRLVGGAVRDLALGLPAADFDLATKHLPGETARRIEAAGARAVPTGIAHGTVTAVWHGGRFEVTTLRRDVATDGRRATVAYAQDWREDAARRDFTLNALYADPLGGTVWDYHGGVDDARAGRVRFIGEPLQRIAEDHLRILRFFRFHARFGRGEPDGPGLAACHARANDLLTLSRERVRDELLKLLCASGVLATLAAMGPVLPVVLPEAVGPDALARLVAREAARSQPCAPVRRLAALLPPDEAVLDKVAARLRLSNAERRRLTLTARRIAPGPLLADAYWFGPDTARDLALLADADTPDLTLLESWTRPKLPVSGGDLIARGLEPGPEVARRLQALERAWVGAGFAWDPRWLASAPPPAA